MTEASRLSIDATDDGPVVLVGVIDSHTTDQLLEGLDALGRDADVSLDLTGVGFIDSSGLRAIVTTHQRLDEAGHRLVLTGVSDAVQRLLEITGLEAHLHVS